MNLNLIKPVMLTTNLEEYLHNTLRMQQSPGGGEDGGEVGP